MLKDITFGQYFDSKSIIHRIDPRVKMVLMILFIVFVDFSVVHKFSFLYSLGVRPVEALNTLEK